MASNNRATWILLFSSMMALLFVQLPVTQAQEPAGKQIANEDGLILKWFDGLGFLDFSGLPLVKVTATWQSSLEKDEKQNDTSYAFLMDDTENGFRAFTLDLSERFFEFTSQGFFSPTVHKFERLNLRETAQTLLRENAERTSKAEVGWPRRFGMQINEGTEFVVIARACAAQGEADLAQQLMDAARDLLMQKHSEKNSESTFQKDLSEDLANMTMWRIILDFSEPNVPRTQLLASLEQFLKNYPETRHCERATESAELLRTMIKEDRDHSVPNFSDLTSDEKVDELIFQLREQNGQQLSQPGSCDIFFGDSFADVKTEMIHETTETEPVESKPRSVSPAQQLVDLGMDAVPKLIDALGDERFTRSVGYHRDFYFSHHVLRVGDCAEKILCRIANRDFYQPTYTNAGMLKDDEQLAVKAQVKEWWREVKKKGEKQVLIEATLAGGRNSIGPARQLVYKYSKEALEAISKGVKSASSDRVRIQLIELLGILGEPAREILKGLMARASSLTTRVAAASQLFKLEPESAVKTMISEWVAISNRSGKGESRGRYMEEGVSELIQFLASRNSLDAAQALRNPFHVHPIATRFEIVTAFGTFKHSLGSSGSNSLRVPNGRTSVNHSVEAEIESLLVTALSDKDRREGLSGNWDEYQFMDPRICDMANYVLALRYPDQYSFDPNAGTDSVEANRIRSINLWRKKNQMELLSEFQPRTLQRVAADKTEPMLTAVLSSTDEQGRAMAIDELLKLGVGALPAVLETIDTSDNQVAVADLRELARQLSTTVTQVTISDDSAPMTTDLEEQLEKFEGRTLSEGQLIELLLSIANDLPRGSTGIRISVQRGSVPSGVEFIVCLTTDWPPENGTQKMWTLNANGVLNGKNIGSSSGSMSVEYATDRNAYSRIANMLKSALDSTHEKPFEIRVTLMRDE